MTVQRDSNQLVEIKETKGEKKEKDHPMKNISYRQHLEQVTNPWHTEIRLQRASVQALDGGLEVVSRASAGVRLVE